MGFLEQGKDVDGMLGELKRESDYRALVRYIWHRIQHTVASS